MKRVNSIYIISLMLAALYIPKGETLQCYKCKYLGTKVPPQYEYDTTFTTDLTCQDDAVPKDSLLQTCSLSSKNIQNTTSFQEDLSVNRCLKMTINGNYGEMGAWYGKPFRATFRTCAAFPETNKPDLGCIEGKIEDLYNVIRPWIHYADDYYFAELIIDNLDWSSRVEICSCEMDKCNSAGRSASIFVMVMVMTIFPFL